MLSNPPKTHFTSNGRFLSDLLPSNEFLRHGRLTES